MQGVASFLLNQKASTDNDLRDQKKGSKIIIKDSKKWHKNFTRLMPYYYVNKKAKFTDYHLNTDKLVRVRKIIKSSKELVIEIAEKIDPKKRSSNINSRKKIKESSLIVTWDDLLEISYQSIKTTNWSLEFIR